MQGDETMKLHTIYILSCALSILSLLQGNPGNKHTLDVIARMITISSKSLQIRIDKKMITYATNNNLKCGNRICIKNGTNDMDPVFGPNVSNN